MSAVRRRLEMIAHQVGLYVSRILKGKKPVQLPVMQAIKSEFIIS